MKNRDSKVDSESNTTGNLQNRHCELLALIGEQQDREAFAEVFAYFAPRVKSFLMKGGLESGKAEELTQESMIKVWRKASSFDRTQASASTWIFTIARNQKIDAFRRDKRGELDPNDPIWQPASEPLADAVMAETQRDEKVRQALKNLPDEQAEMIRLAYFEDKAHAAIAAETDLPLGTVKSRLRLALGRLRRLLDEEEVG